jgi:hypothetical protein
MCLFCILGEHLNSADNIDDLKTINCSGCKNLKKIPKSEHIEELDCSNCPKLKKISKLKNLRVLTCFNCPKLEEISIMESLEKFEYSDCPRLTKVPELKLKALDDVTDEINTILNSKLFLKLKYDTKKYKSSIDELYEDASNFLTFYYDNVNVSLGSSDIVRRLNSDHLGLFYETFIPSIVRVQKGINTFNDIIIIFRKIFFIYKFGLNVIIGTNRHNQLTKIMSKFNEFIIDVKNSKRFNKPDINDEFKQMILNIKPYDIPEIGKYTQIFIAYDDENENINFLNKKYSLLKQQYDNLEPKMFGAYNALYSCISTNNELKQQFDTLIGEDLQKCDSMFDFYDRLYDVCKIIIAQ